MIAGVVVDDVGSGIVVGGGVGVGVVDEDADGGVDGYV